MRTETRHVTPLEPRRLFATVFQGIPGYYEITGTPGNDTIHIAVDQGAGTFTLGGVTYGSVLRVAVNCLDGEDTVTVNSTGSGTISASVAGGPGNDNLSLDIDGAAWGDDGNDVITLRNSFRGEAFGGHGDDQISLSGDCTDAEAHGQGGNDIIWAIDNRYGVALFGGPGNDRLYGSRFDDAIFDGPGTDYVFGLDGSDEVDSRDGELDWIMGGDGIDVLWRDEREGGVNGVEHVFYG